MKSEESIATLITDLEAAKQQAIAVANVFPDAIARVVDKVGLRYHSPTLNECCDKADFQWHWNFLKIVPYTVLVYEVNGIARTIKIHTEPYEIEIASKVMTKITLKSYETELSDLKFNKHIIRLVDIHIAYGIIQQKWVIDKDTLNDKVKMFLVLS